MYEIPWHFQILIRFQFFHNQVFFKVRQSVPQKGITLLGSIYKDIKSTLCYIILSKHYKLEEVAVKQCS